jgi:hypothetical protein
MPTKVRVPKFKTETEEADWLFNHQDYIADLFEKAAAAGTLGHGTVARLARERSSQASPTITIRLPHDDLSRARAQAEAKGMRYQTYIKMLLHEALDKQDRPRR